MSTHKLPLPGAPSPPRISVVSKPTESNAKTVGDDTFLNAMLELSSVEGSKSRSPLKMAVSVVIHAAVVALLILLPVYFAKNVIVPKKLVEPTYIFTPPPPPAPPPPAGATPAPKTVVQQPKIVEPTPLVAPKVVPKTTPETARNTVAAPDVAGGIPGGVPGGVLGGVLGGTGTVPGPPAPPKSPAVVRVGGNVKPPELVQKVQPDYPTVARMAHVQGKVVIDAVISKNGSVISEHAVSGPSLLVPSALQAVKQWKYQPTYLNGQPVDLAMQVTVDFQLGA